MYPTSSPPPKGKSQSDQDPTTTEQSSQWDGFRHHSQPRNTADPSSSTERIFYGGVTKEDILDRSNTRIGTHAWAQQGIAGKKSPLPPLFQAPPFSNPSPSPTGRGILLDYAHYAHTHSIPYRNFSPHAIPFATILAMLKHFHVQPRRGDLLFIRMGVMPEWDAWTPTDQQAYAAQPTPQHAGVEASIDLLEWLWDVGIAAVAGDAISFEVFPTPGPVSVHEYVLAGWGMPIGMLCLFADPRYFHALIKYLPSFFCPSRRTL